MEYITERLGLSLQEVNVVMKLFMKTFDKLNSEGIFPDDIKFFKLFQEAYQNYFS